MLRRTKRWSVARAWQSTGDRELDKIFSAMRPRVSDPFRFDRRRQTGSYGCGDRVRASRLPRSSFRRERTADRHRGLRARGHRSRAARDVHADCHALGPRYGQRLSSLGPASTSGIEDAHLFGVVAPTTAAAEIALRVCARHDLGSARVGNLVRRGRSRESIIVANGELERTYATGDRIDGSAATVRAIYSDRAIIEREGRLETLRLPKDFGGGASVVPPPALQVATASVPRPRALHCPTRPLSPSR